MSALLQPFGLRPAFHPSGLDRAQALAGGITSGYPSKCLKSSQEESLLATLQTF